MSYRVSPAVDPKAEEDLDIPDWGRRITSDLASALEDIALLKSLVHSPETVAEASSSKVALLKKKMSDLTAEKAAAVESRSQDYVCGSRGEEREAEFNAAAVELEAMASAATEPEADVYMLEQSVWDSSILLFTPQVSIAVSIWSVSLLLLNLLLQLFFATQLDRLTDPPFSDQDVTELRRWRTNIAHDLKYLDPLAQTSLAARVCSEDSGVEMSGLQATYVADLNAYLTPTENPASLGLLSGIPVGATVSFVCCVVWMLAVVHELSCIYRVLRAVWAGIGPNSPKQVLAITYTRAVIFSLLQAVRFFIACVLLHSGVLYLGQSTYSIPDLLLNMVALEFILDLDERLYCFTPRRLQARLEQLESLQLNGHMDFKCFGHMDFLSVCKLGIIVVAMPLIATFVIEPSVQQLWNTSDALCSGYTDFVFTLDVQRATNWAKVPESNATNHGSQNQRPWLRPQSELDDLQFNERVIDEVLQWPNGSHDCPKAACVVADPLRVSGGLQGVSSADIPKCCWVAEGQWRSIDEGTLSLNNIGAMSVAEYTESFHPDCSQPDTGMNLESQRFMFVRNYYTFADAAKEAAAGISYSKNGIITLDTCSPTCSDPYKPWCRNGTCVTPTCDIDVLPYCDLTSRAGQNARMLCPEACGCDNPVSGQMSTLIASGCAPYCQHTQWYRDADTRPCTDMTPNDPELIRYATEWPKLATDSTKMFEFASNAARMLISGGCQAYVDEYLDMYNYELWRICGMSSPTTLRELGPFNTPVRGLSYFCPQACQCPQKWDQQNSWGCPGQCLLPAPSPPPTQTPG